MNTVFWGKSGWQFLHTLTFIYPENPTFTDKVNMRDFMTSLQYVLPCKYCRLSFAKYIKSVPIDEYLDTRDDIIDWLYKIHNKINKKLRMQGFCNHPNPELNSIKTHYESIVNKLYIILNEKNKEQIDRTKDSINYICNLGIDFLGSVVFNYQGYFTNCHTSNEKIRIVSVYHTFFNSIIPMLCSYIAKFCKDGKDCVSRYKTTMPKFNIRNILIQNEPYSKLVKWFYECDDLCTSQIIYKTEETYHKHFEKQIVMSCDNPIKSKKTNTCRKTKFLRNKFLRKLNQKHTTFKKSKS